MTRRWERIEIVGILQRVGFGSFLGRLAAELGVCGNVGAVGATGNEAALMFVHLGADQDAVSVFLERMVREAPPLAHLERVQRRTLTEPEYVMSVRSPDRFTVLASAAVAPPPLQDLPDSAVCASCLAELRDPSNRRFRYPFITCGACGPRRTITTALPFERSTTTLAEFEMCTACRQEFDDPDGRRHHAAHLSCHDCGPTVRFASVDGSTVDGDDALTLAQRTLAEGEVVAVKSAGGFQFVCDATNAEAVRELRRRTDRPDEPFAVMVRNADDAARLGFLSGGERRLLGSIARPVVLLEAVSHSEVAHDVTRGNPFIGVALASTPLQHLLLDGVPLVMAPVGRSGAPVSFDSDTIGGEPGLVAFGVLTHDRRISAPCGDSLVRTVAVTDRPAMLLPLRRGWGYAPMPVAVPTFGSCVLATGAGAGAPFCLAVDGHAWVSSHLDVADRTVEATRWLDPYAQAVEQLSTLLGSAPDVVATDLDPDSAVAKWAVDIHGERVVRVQRHHAHVASLMAEHGLDPDERVLGVVFDDAGYGSDGVLWGGEVLIATATAFTRHAHLRPVGVAGGEAVSDRPVRSAFAQIHAAGVRPNLLAPGKHVSEARLVELVAQMSTQQGCVATTSMGSLFEAISSLIGLRHEATFDGQAALELELAARRNRRPPRTYRFGFGGSGQIDQRPVIASIIADLLAGERPEPIADGFHTAVAAVVASIVEQFVAGARQPVPVLLTGSVFENALLLQRTVDQLAAQGRRVYTHGIVPPNDDGVALGQVFVATHRRREQRS